MVHLEQISPPSHELYEPTSKRLTLWTMALGDPVAKDAEECMSPRSFDAALRALHAQSLRTRLPRVQYWIVWVTRKRRKIPVMAALLPNLQMKR